MLDDLLVSRAAEIDDLVRHGGAGDGDQTRVDPAFATLEERPVADLLDRGDLDAFQLVVKEPVAVVELRLGFLLVSRYSFAIQQSSTPSA